MYYNHYLMNLTSFRKTVFDLCQLNPDAPVLVGVSGGPDSLCLLDSLHQLGLRVIAAYFDHQLRPDSARDAQTVRHVADGLGIPVVVGREDVAKFAVECHLSLEDAARRQRYRFLFAQAREHRAQGVAVAHTADDQVETVLMHLLRGAGLTGLTGMRYRAVLADWDASIPLVRPLLNIWREETLAYCQERGFEPVMDPSNQDTLFFRNRVRHEVIPFLETLNPRVRENIWRTAHLLAGDAGVVDAAVQTAWAECHVDQPDGTVTLRLDALRRLPEGLLRAVLRQAISQRLDGLQDVDAAAVERACRLVNASARGKVDLARGLSAFVEAGQLWLTGASVPVPSEWPQLAEPETRLPVPGELNLPGGWRLQSAWVGPEMAPEFSRVDALRWEVWLDGNQLAGELYLRRARPGDRFEPLGMPGHSQKLSDFWINEKLPRRARAAWPLLAQDDRIVWVPGFRPAHSFRITPMTRRVLHIALFKT
mgnify:CR=1 FL=1